MTLSPVDETIIEKLKSVKSASHDPHRPVGVIVADRDGKLLVEGTNQPPVRFGYSVKETQDAIRDDPSWKYFMIEHAERNAINRARDERKDVRGATMYGTLFPCADCARALVEAGIVRLVVPAPGLDPSRDVKWQEHYKYATEILRLAGVRVDTYFPV